MIYLRILADAKNHWHGSAVLTTTLIVLITGCSSKPVCEDVVEVNRQHQQCARLAKVMNNPNFPQQALTARKRFTEECEDLRYQRDDYDTICKNEN
ncbi:hypothetical protein HCJ96_00345 [Alteromonas sp. MYP5]|uniref:Lipoprotein n=2 Tax=Alteromonas ponticola TaxID=2720613 RepID=A0ABX1QW38_9ALTE|nr:hypothetical protein [Alteromonas ponticola]